MEDILPPEPQIEAKKNHFKLIVFILIGLFFIGVATAALFLNYQGYFALITTQNGNQNGQEQKQPLPPPEDLNVLQDYTNTVLEFSVKYPKKAFFSEYKSKNGNIETYQMAFSGPAQINEIKTEADLVDGYIVEINVYKNLANRDLELLTREKRNGFLVQCPANAKISITENIKVNFADAKRFEVDECYQNYIQTFLVRDALVFEIAQIYKGDIGYKQIYKGETEEIAKTFRLTNTLAPSPKDTWTTYSNASRGGVDSFYFKYPQEFDTLCCNIAGPHSTTATKLIVIADPHTIVQGTDKQFNGIGVYLDTLGAAGDFNAYVSEQRAEFEESYQIVIGKNPTPTQKEIEIGGVKGILLVGTAWWADIILLPMPNSNSVIIIAKTVSQDAASRAGIVDEVLESFGFGPVEGL